MTLDFYVNESVLTTQQNKSARGWAMQFYKYAAAMLLESKGGEGGDEIPAVRFLFLFILVLRPILFGTFLEIR